MLYLAIASVVGIILLQLSGAVPDSSVGGPMTLFLAFLLAGLAAGIHEAWTKRRGVVGWIVSILTALVGAVLAGMIGGTLMDFVMPVIARLVNLQGSLAATGHPLLYVLSAVMMLITLGGSWLALSLVNRMR